MLRMSQLGARRPSRYAYDPQRLVIAATAEQVLVIASLFWVLAANRNFFAAALHGREWSSPATWGFSVALLLMLVALHYLLLAPMVNRWTLKPLLTLLVITTAAASYFMVHYNIVLDTSMLRNVLHTEWSEARELLTLSLLAHLLLYAALPLLLLWRVQVVRLPWRRAALVRVGTLLLALGVLVGLLLAVFQPMASLMRNHREVRYLITPANYLWSLAQVLIADSRGAVAPRLAIGLDAAAGPSWAERRKPMLLVLVVGETARAANWGLSGYARQTTPQLAALPLINFAEVTSCGTNTEVSLPCMFAPVGRRDYNEARIRGSQSLLHVLARAGVGVHWRDNQSGCKGVCDGLPNDTVQAPNAPGLCADGRCLDEALLHDLERRLAQASGTQLLVLHPLGNHGPAYHRRYPGGFARFTPACASDDLQHCTREEIVNAYDNALLYTDHVLAQLITRLRSRADRVDSAVIYVSDHGESLGENNLYLHGMPYPIAPSVQTRVPMVMWASKGFSSAIGLDTGCLQHRAAAPASHDHLFHTVLGLLDVRTALYEPAWDLTHACRQAFNQSTQH